jgi:hypothetical protein
MPKRRNRLSRIISSLENNAPMRCRSWPPPPICTARFEGGGQGARKIKFTPQIHKYLYNRTPFRCLVINTLRKTIYEYIVFAHDAFTLIKTSDANVFLLDNAMIGSILPNSGGFSVPCGLCRGLFQRVFSSAKLILLCCADRLVSVQNLLYCLSDNYYGTAVEAFAFTWRASKKWCASPGELRNCRDLAVSGTSQAKRSANCRLSSPS